MTICTFLESAVPAIEKRCVCGHERGSHQHYRRGTECAECAPGECEAFRRARWWRSLHTYLDGAPSRKPER